MASLSGNGQEDLARDEFVYARRGLVGNTDVDVYILMARLSPKDVDGARRATDALLAFWQDVVKRQWNAANMIPSFDFAAHIMKQKGFHGQAEQLSLEAEKLKLTNVGGY